MAGLQHDDVYLANDAKAGFTEKKLASDDDHAVSELDGIHDGLEFPTEEEKRTLPRVPDAIPWNAYSIAFVELCERFSYYGCTVVFTNFIQQSLPANSRTGAGGADGQSGALGLGQRASTGLTTFNTFWVYVIPLFGAYMADTRWGRFKTICISTAVALLGHVLLIISSVPGVIDHPNGSIACFVIAIIIMGLGTGGFKPNISPLVAEQYQRTKLFIRTEKNGERVICDPSLTAARIYMYFYLFINVGALGGQIGMAYAEKFVGFWLAYTLPTIMFSLTPFVLYHGRNKYHMSPPTGSVFAQSLRIWRQAMKGRWTWNPIQLRKNMFADDFWESAKPSNFVKGERPAWVTFDDQWVDEVKRGFKACAVFLWFPIYWLTYNQLNNNLTSQAATMSTHGLPNDVLSNLDPFALVILIPICDRLIYPALRRGGIKFSPIKRITFGFFTGAAAMIWSAVVQHYVYKTSPCGYYASSCTEPDVSPLNVWIQTGSYVLIALSEIFASITSLEYAFTKAPKNMRSLVMGICLFMSAISSAIGEAFVSLSTDPLLVWNYGVMAVLAGVSGVIFWFQFRHLDAQDEDLNNIGEGHFEEKH